MRIVIARPPLILLATATVTLRRDFLTETEQSDEPLRVGLPVDVVFAERGQILAVEPERRSSADRAGSALVELHPHVAGDRHLGAIDEGVERLAQRREPEAVVDQIGVGQRQLVLEPHRRLVQRQMLQLAVGGGEDRAAGRLVDAAALHPDQPVLQQVDAADAVLAADGVERSARAPPVQSLPSRLTGHPSSNPSVT